MRAREAHSALSVVEQTDDSGHEADELVQRGNDWLTPEHVDFADNYANGHINLAVRRRNARGKYRGAIIVGTRPCLQLHADERPAGEAYVVFGSGHRQQTGVLPSQIDL